MYIPWCSKTQFYKGKKKFVQTLFKVIFYVKINTFTSCLCISNVLYIVMVSWYNKIEPSKKKNIVISAVRGTRNNTVWYMSIYDKKKIEQKKNDDFQCAWNRATKEVENIFQYTTVFILIY